jgi:hypothetical protein
MKTKKIYKKKQNTRKMRLAKTKSFHTKKTAKKHNRTSRKLGDKLSGGFFGRLFGKKPVNQNTKDETDLMTFFSTGGNNEEIIKKWDEEIKNLTEFFNLCIENCYNQDKNKMEELHKNKTYIEKETIKNTLIANWSKSCSEYVSFCQLFVEQSKKIEEIVKNILKNNNVSLKTKDIVASGYEKAMKMIETKREIFISIAEEIFFETNKENKLNLTERDIFLQKNEEDILNMFMDDAFQTISFYKDCELNFFIKRNCKSYDDNNTKLEKFYEDIFMPEKIKNEPENYYKYILNSLTPESESESEPEPEPEPEPENSISNKTKETLIVIKNTTNFLMNKNTPKKTVLNFLSEYKKAKSVYEKYEAFEKNKQVSSNSSFQKSKSLLKRSTPNGDSIEKSSPDRDFDRI